MNSDNHFQAARAPPRQLFLMQLYHRFEVKAIAKKENIVTISVPYPADKYEALLFFAKQKGEKIEDYMVDSLESWYRKKVDVGVRRYLDAKYEQEFGTPPGPMNIPAEMPEGSANFPSWES